MKYRIIVGIIAAAAFLPLYFWVKSLAGGLLWTYYLYETGRAAALAAVPLIAAQYILTSRRQILERGVGLDRLTGLHRWIGLALCLMLLAHPSLMMAAERLQGYSSPFAPARFPGVAALLCTLVAAGAALMHGRISFFNYERWKAFHLAAYGILPLAMVHGYFLGYVSRNPAIRVLWVLAAAVYVFAVCSRFRRMLLARRNLYRVVSVNREARGVWTISLGGTAVSYLPGQFMFVQLERRSMRSSQHPFTISSSPTRPGLSFTVKESGDFTCTAGETEQGAAAYLEGPFGTFSILDHPAGAYMFIAGGIGVTPFISMIRYLRDTDSSKAVTLIWANKTQQDIPFRDELTEISRFMPRLRIVHVLSREPSWPGEKGRITTGMLSGYMYESEGVEYFVCGPEGMMEAAVGSLKELGVPGNRIHRERFRLP